MSRITPGCHLAAGALCCLALAGNLSAETLPVPPPGLKQAFVAAWLRQPEAQSLAERRDAATARQQVAESWTAEPPTLELSGKTDQAGNGSREYVAGLALPLWLPGERGRSAALADAEAQAVGSRASAAQLRTAAAVRAAWWNWQRARGEQALAGERLASARRLAEDVAKRVKAGDLARADQHQAEGAAALAEVALAEANSLLATTVQQLRALTGALPAADSGDAGEPAPAVPADFSAQDATHPLVRELFDRAELARRAVDLAGVQRGNHPELLLATSRERGALGDDWQHSVSLGIRIPFASASRQRASIGTARADAIEREGQWRLERERLAAELDAARQQVEAAQARQAAADRRAQLARESRGFFEKSFRLGETDLPTRLRIELDAVDAERHSARARIDRAAAVSNLRQALGLLPE